MNSPLNRSRWGMAEPSYNNYKAPSKVVSIPVHFVGSERSRSDSAVKIQKVVRGFLVRNTLRKIASMRVELERIESEVDVEVLKRIQRERVRVSETIMNLLLRLDSVRVLNYSGLRECRKSLINKTIALQEMIDRMTVTEEEKEGECVVNEEEGEGMETLKNEKEEKEGEIRCEEQGEGEGVEALVGENCLVEEEESENRCEEDEEGEEIEGLGNEEVMEVEEKEDGEGGMVGENCFVEEEKGDCDCDWEGDRREEGDGKKRELLLEKMVEDNEKMMEMMAQLFQRNEMQTRLLTSLSQRVELLERAFTCDKLRRKKKRNCDAKNKQSHPKNGFI